MATAAAMAALRATALGDCGGGSCDEDTVAITLAADAIALFVAIVIALATLTIILFVACHLVAVTIAHFVTGCRLHHIVAIACPPPLLP